MISLYHCMSARSFRPLWTLEELGAPYQLHMLPFPPRQLAREFLAVNPLGTVPALCDGELLMTESAAMCQYLSQRFGPSELTVNPDESDYGSYLNWLHAGEATLTFPQTLLLRYGRFESVERRQPQVVEDYQRWFLARLRGVDRALEQGDYLCQQRFTAADISVGYALLLAEFLGLAESFPGRVPEYWHRLKQRPGYVRAMAVQERAAIEQGVPTVHAPLSGA